MFGGQNFMPMMGQLRLAQTPTPGQTPAPAPATQVAPPPVTPVVAPAPAPVVVSSGLSHGTQVLIAAGVAGLALLGAALLTE